MPARPLLQHDLQREVDLYATGCNTHKLRSVWTTYLMLWQNTPQICTKSQLRQLNECESKLRIELQKCKPTIFRHLSIYPPLQ
jgi:hypothetical protein